jgi:hypothetical protein
MSNSYAYLNPLLSPDDAEQMLAIAERLGRFGTYADEGTSEGLGESLPQRFDVGLNYVVRGLDGKGCTDEPAIALGRTNYFRETYIYGDEQRVEGIESFAVHALIGQSARSLMDSSVLVPAIVYANILVPGQELAIHTDVPEFRGLNRRNAPQWLLVCMLHSGLFDRWRVPIATCVAWFGGNAGGAFTFYPDGASGRRESIPADHNTAIVLDTDKVFHGVERVKTASLEETSATAIADVGSGASLDYRGGGQWHLETSEGSGVDFGWADLRYSISWKGYCFDSPASHQKWLVGEDSLTIAQVQHIFEDDLAQRGIRNTNTLSPNDYAQLLVQTYVSFPEGAASI